MIDESGSGEVDDRVDLSLARHIAAAPAAVWKAWTDPDLLRRWWAPERHETLDCLIEARVGGQFTTIMRTDAGDERTSRGVYLELVENERIIFTDALLEGFRPSGAGFFTGVILLEAVDGGTRCTVRALHKDAEDRRRHEEDGFLDNLSSGFDRMERLLGG